jgi:hypothetical protein
MSFCIGITIDLLEDLLSCPSGPDEFFDQLIASLQHSSTDMDFTFKIIRSGRSNHDAADVLDRYLNTGYDNADTALSPIRSAILSALSTDRHSKGPVSLFGPRSQHKSHPNFVLSSRAVSSKLSPIPSYMCQLQWDDHNDLIGLLRAPNDSKTYWCVDYDETLILTQQGGVRFNEELLGCARSKLMKGNGCILTARTDPVYLYKMIEALIGDYKKSNFKKPIRARISSFDRKKFEELTGDKLEVLRAKVNGLWVSPKVKVPLHRKALLKELMCHLEVMMQVSADDLSPWEVKAVPSKGRMFFMNTRVQMIVNDHVAHCVRPLLLKGEFARGMLRRNPDLSEVVLIDDSYEQCLDWVEVGSKAAAYRVTQSFLSDIPRICQNIHDVVTVNLNRHLLMLSDKDSRKLFVQESQIRECQGVGR